MPIGRIADTLKDMPMFRSFRDEELFSMVRAMKIREFVKGQVIHLQGEPCTSMDVVAEGKVSVESIGADGSLLRVATFGPGSVLGMNLIFASKNSYPMTVVADSRSTIVSIPKDMVLDMGRVSFSFTEWLLMEISDRTLLLTDKLGSISMKTIRQKVLEYLYAEYLRQKSLSIRMDLTKKELAERLGINRTSLSREMDRMRKDRVIDFYRNSITILNLEAVTGTIDGNPQIRY
jgi:CRP-like cAMP-binding protein